MSCRRRDRALRHRHEGSSVHRGVVGVVREQYGLAFQLGAAINDPVQRLRVALSDTYTWAGSAAPMMTKIYRDLQVMSAFVGASLIRDEQARVAILAAGFQAPGRKAQRLHAALRHALHFQTWQSLCLLGELRDENAIELMARPGWPR